MIYALQARRYAATLFIIACLFVALAAIGWAFRRGNAPAHPATPASISDIFIDATASSGLDFVHTNGMKGEYYFSEIIGSGVAIFDYDNDGRPDILVLDGTPLGEAKASEGRPPCSARLFHNELTVGEGGVRALKFTDVTAKSGLCARGYGMGVAVGDYDNDGFVDLFITHFDAPNQLFHNNGDGTFSDVTESAGVGG